MKQILVPTVVAALAVLPGCAEPDRRVADMAQKFANEQSQQNQRVAEGSKAVAEGSKQLVENDAKARREIVGLQQDLRRDWAEVGKQRDQLEEERIIIAGQRVQDSKAGALCVGLAIILVCLAPLVLAGMSLLGLWKSPTQEEEREVLLQELTVWLSHESGPAPTALPDSSSRQLTPPGAGS